MTRKNLLIATVLFLSVGLTVKAASAADTMETSLAQYLADQASAAPLAEAEPTIGSEVEYTLDLSRSSQSAFKVFGSVASTRPIATLDLVGEKGDWSAEVIVVRGIGEQNVGDLAHYYDAIFTRSWSLGNFSSSVGAEVFYAAPQLGNASSTFIVPTGTVGWSANDHFAVELGAQWVGTYHTNYDGGDRVFGWFQPTFSYGVSRLSVSFSPGYVLGETGRSTLYMSGSATVSITSRLDVYASYLEAESWSTGVPGMVPIDGTWTGGATFSFDSDDF